MVQRRALGRLPSSSIPKANDSVSDLRVADPPVASADGIVKIWFLDLELASLLAADPALEE